MMLSRVAVTVVFMEAGLEVGGWGVGPAGRYSQMGMEKQ